MKPYFSFSTLSHRIRNSRILSGALLLTTAGMISRVIGFFYRIFLSRSFGAENIGIYQLISPVIALSYSLSVAGFQTAISRITATTVWSDPEPVEKARHPRRVFAVTPSSRPACCSHSSSPSVSPALSISTARRSQSVFCWRSAVPLFSGSWLSHSLHPVFTAV